MNTNRNCPMCHKADLVFKTATETYTWQNREYTVQNIEYAECPHCHAEIITAEQIQRNEIRIRDVRPDNVGKSGSEPRLMEQAA